MPPGLLQAVAILKASCRRLTALCLFVYTWYDVINVIVVYVCVMFMLFVSVEYDHHCYTLLWLVVYINMYWMCVRPPGSREPARSETPRRESLRSAQVRS